jgi:hypothetical protein
MLIACFAFAALSAGTIYAKPAKTVKAAAQKTDQRAASARRQLAQDLHWRGSNIPPALSSAHRWTR